MYVQFILFLKKLLLNYEISIEKATKQAFKCQAISYLNVISKMVFYCFVIIVYYIICNEYCKLKLNSHHHMQTRMLSEQSEMTVI